MKSGDYIPDKGDIVWISFDLQTGHERETPQERGQKGKRPALILSPKIYNQKTSLSLCLPITSKIKGYPFEVALPNNIKIDGVILSDQIKNLDFKARKVTFICKAPDHIVHTVQQNVLALIMG